MQRRKNLKLQKRGEIKTPHLGVRPSGRRFPSDSSESSALAIDKPSNLFYSIIFAYFPILGNLCKRISSSELLQFGSTSILSDSSLQVQTAITATSNTYFFSVIVHVHPWWLAANSSKQSYVFFIRKATVLAQVAPLLTGTLNSDDLLVVLPVIFPLYLQFCFMFFNFGV